MALCENKASSGFNDSEKLELKDTPSDNTDRNVNVKESAKWSEIPLPSETDTRTPLREEESFGRGNSICPNSTMEKRFIAYGVVTFLVIIVAIVLMLQENNKSMKLAGGVVIAVASGLSCVVMALDLALSRKFRRQRR